MRITCIKFGNRQEMKGGLDWIKCNRSTRSWHDGVMDDSDLELPGKGEEEQCMWLTLETRNKKSPSETLAFSIKAFHSHHLIGWDLNCHKPMFDCNCDVFFRKRLLNCHEQWSGGALPSVVTLTAQPGWNPWFFKKKSEEVSARFLNVKSPLDAFLKK